MLSVVVRAMLYQLKAVIWHASNVIDSLRKRHFIPLKTILHSTRHQKTGTKDFITAQNLDCLAQNLKIESKDTSVGQKLISK